MHTKIRLKKPSDYPQLINNLNSQVVRFHLKTSLPTPNMSTSLAEEHSVICGASGSYYTLQLFYAKHTKCSAFKIAVTFAVVVDLALNKILQLLTVNK